PEDPRPRPPAAVRHTRSARHHRHPADLDRHDHRELLMNRFIRRLGDLSARRPWTVIGSWAVLAALVAVLSGALGGAFADDFGAPGSASANAMDLLDERFPAVAGGTAVAVFAAPEGQQVRDFRAAADTALSRVAQVERV